MNLIMLKLAQFLRSRSATFESLAARTGGPSFQSALFRGFSTGEQKKLFVGNLPWVATEEDIAAVFQKYGQVVDSFILTDRETGRSRGMAFITMDAEAAEKALTELNGTNFMGRTMRVEYSLPKDPNRARGPGGGFGGGFGGDRPPRRDYGGGGGGGYDSPRGPRRGGPDNEDF